MSLQKLGITQYGERIYTTLLAYGSSTAKELSQRSSVPPTAVYPVVQQLVEQGLVQRIDGSVQRFEAIPPKTALQQLTRNRFLELKATKEQALEQLSKIEQQEEVVHTPIRLSQGKEQSIDYSTDVVELTKQTFYVLGWNLNHKKSVFAVMKLIRPLKKQGVDIRFLFTHRTATGDYFRELLDGESIPYRFVKTGYISVVISDAKRCKITLKRKELSERVNIAVEEADLAVAMQQYFLKLWGSSKKQL